ncbi:MAG: hypothetical protein GX973_01810 [Firmicutes bacterium]|nr:hypothetical protein [Bacillota bacterium]
MNMSRFFPYEKSIVINALYDIIEALGLYLNSANSARGMLLVSDMEHTGKMCIALNFAIPSKQTQVDIFPGGSNLKFAERWGPAVLNELSERVKRVHQQGEVK